MQHFRCKCGSLRMMGTDYPAPCRTCLKCGSTLADHPGQHREPVPHEWETSFDQTTGKPREYCKMCLHFRDEVEPKATSESPADEAYRLIDELRSDEGDSVTIHSDNPGDGNDLPNCCISVAASWTDWEQRDFRADTVLKALRLAAKEKSQVLLRTA